MLLTLVTAKAMNYEQARNEALFLTDKMAYELNLTDKQYEAAYEINLDYLMGVTSYDDVYGNYWERRNRDLSFVLLDWQWSAFCAASYFYRPLTWSDGYWHFGIYLRYPHRDYFYFGRPVFYASYRGNHAWHVVGGMGYYHGRQAHYRPVGRSHFGMLDRWNRGDFHHHKISHPTTNHHAGRPSNRNSHTGGIRNSSTRTTVHRNNNRSTPIHSQGSFSGNRNNAGSFGGGRSNNSFSHSNSGGTRGAGHSTQGGRSFGGRR